MPRESRSRAACTRVARPALALLLAGLQAAGVANAAPGLALYGRLDSGIVKRSGEGWSLTQAASSRWGLSGSEDIGGGAALAFRLESGFASDTGKSDNGFRRESWVGVRGSFGTVRLGRSLSPSQRLVSEHDPFGTDGVGSFGSTALLLGHTRLVRLDNALWYEPPPLGGARVSAAYALADDAGERADAWSLRARYEGGPVDVSIALADAGPPGNAAASIGASYRIGKGRLMGQLTLGERDANLWSSALVGATLPFGPTELRTAFSRVEQRGGGIARRDRFAIGLDHAVSARTAFYATVAHDSERGTGRDAAGRGGSRGAAVELGLRHEF